MRTLVAVAAAVVGTLSLTAPAHANRLLPGFTRVASGPAGGMILRGTFPSSTAPKPLRAGAVYLPPGFNRTRRYPVVYLLHGMPGDPSEYTDSLALATVGDTLITSGRVRPFVAVLPAAGPTGKYNGEWTGPWERYVVDDVVPWVDTHLPTAPSRRDRILAGLSAGGFGAVDIGLRSPTLFGALESWSGYFHPLHDGPLRHASSRELAANDPALLAVEKTSQLKALGTRFFVGSGPSHSHWFKESETVAFAHELGRLGIPHRIYLVAGERGQYARQLAAGLVWALPAGQAATGR